MLLLHIMLIQQCFNDFFILKMKINDLCKTNCRFIFLQAFLARMHIVNQLLRIMDRVLVRHTM